MNLFRLWVYLFPILFFTGIIYVAQFCDCQDDGEWIKECTDSTCPSSGSNDTTGTSGDPDTTTTGDIPDPTTTEQTTSSSSLTEPPHIPVYFVPTLATDETGKEIPPTIKSLTDVAVDVDMQFKFIHDETIAEEDRCVDATVYILLQKKEGVPSPGETEEGFEAFKTKAMKITIDDTTMGLSKSLHFDRENPDNLESPVLEPSTYYMIYVYLEDSIYNAAGAVIKTRNSLGETIDKEQLRWGQYKTLVFRTEDAQGIPQKWWNEGDPTMEYPRIDDRFTDENGNASFKTYIKVVKNGTVQYIVRKSGEAAPTLDELKASTDAISVKAGVETVIETLYLLPATEYKIYLIAKDIYDQYQSQMSVQTITTLSNAPDCSTYPKVSISYVFTTTHQWVSPFNSTDSDAMFIELYNYCSSPVDLAGWTLQMYHFLDATGAMLNDNNFADCELLIRSLELSGTIQPRSFFLIGGYRDAAEKSIHDFYQPDLRLDLKGEGGLSFDGKGIALVNTKISVCSIPNALYKSNVIDKVGFRHEGSERWPYIGDGPSQSESYLEQPNNGCDNWRRKREGSSSESIPIDTNTTADWESICEVTYPENMPRSAKEITSNIPPVVLKSVPAEYAYDANPDTLNKITFYFDKPMNTRKGSVEVISIGKFTMPEGSRWIDYKTYEFLIDGTDYVTDYQFNLVGFEDISGNALDTHNYFGENGLLDFTTTEQTFPYIANTYPVHLSGFDPTITEGDLVAPDFGTLTFTKIIFNELMSTEHGQVVIYKGTASVKRQGWGSGPCWTESANPIEFYEKYLADDDEDNSDNGFLKQSLEYYIYLDETNPDMEYELHLVGFRNIYGSPLDPSQNTVVGVDPDNKNNAILKFKTAEAGWKDQIYIWEVDYYPGDTRCQGCFDCSKKPPCGCVFPYVEFWNNRQTGEEPLNFADESYYALMMLYGPYLLNKFKFTGEVAQDDAIIATWPGYCPDCEGNINIREYKPDCTTNFSNYANPNNSVLLIQCKKAKAGGPIACSDVTLEGIVGHLGQYSIVNVFQPSPSGLPYTYDAGEGVYITKLDSVWWVNANFVGGGRLGNLWDSWYVGEDVTMRGLLGAKYRYVEYMNEALATEEMVDNDQVPDGKLDSINRVSPGAFRAYGDSLGYATKAKD